MPAALQDDERGGGRLLEALRATVEPVEVEAGATVVRQGDEGQALYVVESGAVDVVVQAAEGLRLPVARLGPGSHFGEMSLLAGTPISADVVASERTVLYCLSPEQFDDLVREDADLMRHVAGELAVRLKRTNEQLSALQQRQASLGKLMGARADQAFLDDLPSFTKKLTAAVEGAAQSDEPMLITGEGGAGRAALAQYIHSLGPRADKPVLMVDCRELSPEDAGSDLFGQCRPDSVTRFADRLGYVQAADGGTVVLLHVERLPPEAQEDVATFLRASRSGQTDVQVDVRVIATSREASEDDAEDDGWHEPLREILTQHHAIALRSLRKRRRDIAPLAEHFIVAEAQRNGRQPKELTESARRELQGYDFPYGNVAELKQVIELAALLAPGDVVSAEHLFFGPGGGAEAAQIDLLRWPWLEKIVVEGRLLPALRVVVAVFFAGIVAACLAVPATLIGKLANLAVWGLWWPGLVVSLVILGRAWCAVCPLSSSGEIVQRVGGRGIEPSEMLKRGSAAFAVVGFVAIVWVEEVTGMVGRPVYTALLLISLGLAASVMGWLYQRHTWCRYVCPLGAMGAVLSVASGLRISARREVCGASCVGHECYKGSDTDEGCPMFSHALFMTSGQHCKLCMACLRSCPSHSPRLVAQPPLRDIWRSDLIAADLAPLVVVIGLMAMLLSATSLLGPRAEHGASWFTMGSVAALAVGIGLWRLFRVRAQAEGSRDVSWTARAIYAYAPAAAALLFAFHVRSLPWLDETALRLLSRGQYALELSLLNLVQWTAGAAGVIMTLLALWVLCRGRFGSHRLKAVAAWSALGGLAAICMICGVGWVN